MTEEEDDDPTVAELHEEQAEREREERARAERTDLDTEEHKAIRRADKAAYLRSKLEQQADHPDEPDDAA